MISNDFATIEDLLYFFPRDYQDRSKIFSVTEALETQTTATSAEEAAKPVLLKGHISAIRFIPIRNLPRPLLEAKFSDATGSLSLKWFAYNKNYLLKRLQEHPHVLAYGTLRSYQGKWELLHPELEYLDAESSEPVSAQGIVPIYVEHEGLNQKLIRRLVGNALEKVTPIPETLPRDLLEKFDLMDLSAALKEVHAPRASSLSALQSHTAPAQRRIIFEDLFKFQFSMGLRRKTIRQKTAAAFPFGRQASAFSSFVSKLPFALTQDQNHALDRIFQDLSLPQPMNRLLQGDVGCGKTLVALGSVLAPLAHGAQAAFLAPTEILAQQHLRNAQNIFTALGFRDEIKRPYQVELLAGSTPKAKRNEILTKLANGEIDLLIGTHALMEPGVCFHNLGFVIIDEQHRFGVDQRAALRAKGKHFAHLLSMTATPIPRTLALTVYGDLDVTVIRELPSGRKPITTKIVTANDIEQMYVQVREQLRNGQQAYVIFPLVEESEKIDLSNAIDGAEMLAHGSFREFKVGLLHGRMTGTEKNDVMSEFKQGKIQVLVSTTVIEVGVDVPNATVLIVEHSERFGLSQLHQLRGRVGRGHHQSYCFLSVNSTGPAVGSTKSVAMERLKAMEETQDGFRLAELDLKLRGPGEFMGTRQAGELNFPMANLVRDQNVLTEARRAAFEILTEDPTLELSKNAPLRHLLTSKDGQVLFDRLGSG